MAAGISTADKSQLGNGPSRHRWTAVHVHDLQAAEIEFPEGADYARRYGHRTTLATPLLRQGKPIGAILIRRMEVRPFSDQQMTLLKMFADQAVIAIENVRLFEAEQARTRELTESLQQQTGYRRYFTVISIRSTIDLQPVSRGDRAEWASIFFSDATIPGSLGVTGT